MYMYTSVTPKTAVSGPHRLFATAIFGPPLPRLVPSIFSNEFELPTVETHCHMLFINISVPDGHHYPTKYSLVLQVVTLKELNTNYKHVKGCDC